MRNGSMVPSEGEERRGTQSGKPSIRTKARQLLSRVRSTCFWQQRTLQILPSATGHTFPPRARRFPYFCSWRYKWVTCSVSGHGNRLATEFWSQRKPSISPERRYFNWRYTMSVTGILSSSMFSNQVDPNRTSCARSHTHHHASGL